MHIDNRPVEPKKKNRFIVRLPEEFQISTSLVYECERPKFKYNGYHLIPEPISLGIYDPIAPSITSAIWGILIGLTDVDMVLPELKVKHQDMFGKFINGFDYKIEILDPVGNIVETWQLLGCKIINVDFGGLNWSNDTPCVVKLLVKPQKAYLEF